MFQLSDLPPLDPTDEGFLAYCADGWERWGYEQAVQDRDREVALLRGLTAYLDYYYGPTQEAWEDYQYTLMKAAEGAV